MNYLEELLDENKEKEEDWWCLKLTKKKLNL